MFYVLITKDEYETGLPMPILVEQIESKEDAPEGSEVVESQKEADAIVEKELKRQEKLVIEDPDNGKNPRDWKGPK